MKQLKKDPLNLIITGVGGQGNVMIALIVGNVLVREGYSVTVGETYGASQRGGPVMSHLRISSETQYGPIIPDGCGDIILGMEPVETMRMMERYGNPDVMTIINNRPIYSIDVTCGNAEYPDTSRLIEAIRSLSAKTWVINATGEAQKMGSHMYANAILIGALVGADVLPIDRSLMEPVIKDAFPREIETNMAAFNRGIELMQLAR